ncbi:hypothetical protein [Nonomuraea wenchangensis]|uniref:hypothetical protein n=1 Tax=Nonomuraea wenchangensis TaxID=568860 RepID=UPI0033296230
MQIVYSRVSTASQSLLRQRHILTEAGLLVRTEGAAEGFRPADGVLLFEDPATTSKIPALDRPAFGKIAAKAHPGDTLRAGARPGWPGNWPPPAATTGSPSPPTNGRCGSSSGSTSSWASTRPNRSCPPTAPAPGSSWR